MILGYPLVEPSEESKVDAIRHENGVEIVGTAGLTCCVLMADSCLPEIDGDDMVRNGFLLDTSKRSQANAEDEKTDIKRDHAVISDGYTLGKCNDRSMGNDSSAVALRQSQESLKNHEKEVKEVEIIVPDSAQVKGTLHLQVGTDTMTMYGSPTEASRQTQGNVKEVKKQLKRKRASIDGNAIYSDKESLIRECHRELDGLFEYYKEVSGYKMNVEEGNCSSNNSVIACLLEESNLSFSKLVEEIYEKLKAREGITLSSVRSAVLFVGQRMTYGIANADADVLEDESDTCLWCWETRDMKLLPRNQCGLLSIRRTARKKIHDRISALSATLSVLSIPESLENCRSDLLRASEKLGKASNGPGIRSLVKRLKEKNDADMAEKEARLKEKELIKELEKSKRNAENEKKRIGPELQKGKSQSEKELKRLQEEAEKELRRHEKEEAELKRQLKKQQEEAERDLRRREKEAAELKKQISIQKQASIMERFLKCQKSNDKSNDPKVSLTNSPVSNSSCKKEAVVDANTSSIDFALSQKDGMALEDLRRLHVACWHKLSCSNRSCRWGIRRNPKIELIKNIKLRRSSFGADPKSTTTNEGLASNKWRGNGEQSNDKPVDECEQSVADDILCEGDFDAGSALPSLSKKKLLQFDKSHRPAYYGTKHKKSVVVGPRHPFKKDPDMDYDVDSDEEWEEEDPGESLSDCDKDDEEECLEEENTKTEDEDEHEDHFIVPDGYLSENEGIQAASTSNLVEDDSRSTFSCRPEIESEEFKSLLRHQKYLHHLTELALQKSQPLIIPNLMHEMAEIMMVEDLSGPRKNEHICLQALCMRACPGGPVIDASVNCNPANKDQEDCQSQKASVDTPVPTAVVISNSDLPEFVASIRLYSHGINKVLDSLQHKFPTIPKSQLENKVREISDLVDNHWQVKREVLDRIGLSSSPDKHRRPKGTLTFFSKRCLPPSGGSMTNPETSPQMRQKTNSMYGDNGQTAEI